MMSAITNWIARRGITGISFGRSARHAPPGTLVFFPYDAGTLNCGITGIVAFKRQAGGHLPLQELERILDEVAAYGWDEVTAQGLDPETHYLGGPSRLKNMQGLGARLGEQALFYEIYAGKGYQDRLSALSQRAADLIDVEDRGRMERKGRESPHTDTLVAERLTSLRDIQWSLERETLRHVDQIKRLAPWAASACTPAVVGLLKELNLILNNLDRLEVRGRDSAGLSLLFVMRDADYATLLETLARTALLEAFQARQMAAVLGDGSIAVSREKTGVSLALTYKVAAEVGSLGDNVAYLRRQLRDDAILPHLMQAPHVHHTFLAHTRWASVGEISVANCHPMDGDRTHGPCLIHVCLNGDIDNHQALRQSLERDLGLTVPDEITTDTKIIPLQIQRYLDRGEPLDAAFRLAVNDFDGSHAIAMHASLAPGQLFLAQKGSGQTLFIGLASDHYVVGSEIYGLVEETSRYLKMDGTKAVDGVAGPTQGQIFVLQQDSEGELDGIRAMFYDGTPIALSPGDIKETAITSRDIDRQHYPHYFLKEISESPRSVEQTMQGRLAVVESDGQRRPQILLDHTVISPQLESALKQQQIRHIFFIGQGTAGVAGSVCASLLRTFLSPTTIQVTSCKASEFSGFMLDEKRPDTLVVAITQSGTTTDTNRAIDIARGQRAHTMAIVNRRDSDITFKVDGVLYTSSGRDIEMSVASTKAYYAQIVAGSILGLKLAQLTDARPEAYILAEIEQVWRLPKLMEKVLVEHREIEVSAKRFAVIKRHWAVVGSGPNKAAADEIRIKLSELCYKTISSDVVEDKKHIDLSAEPLIFVCAAGNREDVLSDIVKDTAIFKAHHAVPVVVATEGEHRFDPYADAVIYVPEVSAGLAPIINTLAGHLWGYYAALAISEESRPLFEFREEIRQHVSAAVEKGLDVYEVVLDEGFREKTIKFYQLFKERLGRDRYTATTDIRTVADVTLLLKYMSGRLPTADFEFDFGLKGTAPNLLATFFDGIGKMIDEMTRPIDAIRHQAKTVTVGTSRLVEQVDGLLFDTLRTCGFDRGHLTTANVLVLRRLQEIVGHILGATLYKIAGLNLLGEPVATSTIEVEKKEGSSALLSSRAEADNRLRGTKQIIVKNGNVFIGKGRRDQRSILAIPLMSQGTTIDRLLLLHVGFRQAVELRKQVEALGGKYQHIRQLVEEMRLPWQDRYLNWIQMDDLFGLSAEKISELIVAQSSHEP